MKILSMTARRIVRRVADEKYPWPIVVTTGTRAPELVGEKWHYRTKGGRRIYHPSAYRTKGWSNCIYVKSSLRIEVGDLWLRRRFGARYHKHVFDLDAPGNIIETTMSWDEFASHDWPYGIKNNFRDLTMITIKWGERQQVTIIVSTIADGEPIFYKGIKPEILLGVGYKNVVATSFPRFNDDWLKDWIKKYPDVAKSVDWHLNRRWYELGAPMGIFFKAKHVVRTTKTWVAILSDRHVLEYDGEWELTYQGEFQTQLGKLHIYPWWGRGIVIGDTRIEDIPPELLCRAVGADVDVLWKAGDGEL